MKKRPHKFSITNISPKSEELVIAELKHLSVKDLLKLKKGDQIDTKYNCFVSNSYR